MKLKNKFLLGILAVSMVCMILQPNISNAALQSNGGTPATKSLSDWMLQIRQMQELGGTLGRKDTVSTSHLTSNATDLDIHMEKNTEYGAMAILSASAYGNPNPIGDGETTTGNKTGVVISYNNEWTAAQYTDKLGTTNYSDRYINYYNISENIKLGDATVETQGWHGTSYFYSYGQSDPAYQGNKHGTFYPGGVVRNLLSGIFSYDNNYRYDS